MNVKRIEKKPQKTRPSPTNWTERQPKQTLATIKLQSSTHKLVHYACKPSTFLAGARKGWQCFKKKKKNQTLLEAKSLP